jgi:DNA (cytosine-5)-methyltransferase 1
MMRSVELFSGAGGLALGIARAGFDHLAVVERDRSACMTLRTNQARHVEKMSSWPVWECDVREFNYSLVEEDVDLVAGGVPCQPFSIGGKHRGHADERNMFPELVAAVRRLKPRAILVENVRGLARPAFAKYFGYIELMLTYPEIQRKQEEEWFAHLARLERYHTRGKRDGLYYRVVHRVLNSADYGVPQRRERLFMVAIRADLGIEWSFPSPTHSRDALLWEQFCTGEYWQRHKVRKVGGTTLSESVRDRVNTLRESLLPPPSQKAWLTVRDAILDLPKPAKSRTQEEPGLNHFAIHGAREYVGHSGSPLDEPSKTLKAGVHGVPGGENMLAMQDGSVRYFTIRESARLQTFPDDYVFPCSWTESMRQIGNAVPVKLGELIARKLASVLHPKIGAR